MFKLFAKYQKYWIVFVLGSALLLTGCVKKDNYYQGYIEGKYTYLSSAISGRLDKLEVKRGDLLKTGQVVFVLDQEPENSQLIAAQQKLAQAEQTLADIKKGQRQTILDQITAQKEQVMARLRLDDVTLKRYRILYSKQVITKQTLDTAQSTYDADFKKQQELISTMAEAKLPARENQILAQEAIAKEATAQINQAEWALSQKTVYAPADSQVFDMYYRIGEFVAASSPVVSILKPNDIKLIFFIPEPILSKMKINQSVKFGCDNCAAKYSATIDYISSDAEYTPPVIYSRASRDKLVYRIEAAIAPETAKQLRTGQPIDVWL